MQGALPETILAISEIIHPHVRLSLSPLSIASLSAAACISLRRLSGLRPALGLLKDCRARPC